MKGKVYLLALVLVFLSLTFVSADPPFQQGTFTTGYEIKFPAQQILQQNQDYDFHFHVFNISTGHPVTQAEGVACFFHLYNSSGNHLLRLNASYDPSNVPNEWEVKVKGGNFSKIGMMSYLIQCNSDTLGGFDSVGFDVTPNGKEFTTGNAIAYLGFLLLTLITLFLTLLGASKVKWKHKKDKEGKIISINDFRYVKVFLFSMSYMIAMFLFGLSYKLFNEAGMEGFNNFFNFVYQLFLRLMYPVIIVTVLIFVVIFLSNLKLKRNKELGL